MSETHPRLLIAEGAAIAEAALVPLAGCAAVRRFRTLDEVAGELSCAVLVAPPEAVRRALAARPADEGGAEFVAVVWCDGSAPDRALLDHPQVVGALDRSCPGETVYVTLRSALTRIAQTHEGRAAQMLARVLEIGRALASEKDLDTLLGLILTHARHLTNADGASIYTRDRDGVLYFRLWQNASVAAMASPQKTPVGEDSIAGYVARAGDAVVLDDAYAIPDSVPYRFNSASDRALGYRTRSLLTVPLKNKADEVVGVLQLINRKRDPQQLLRAAADFDRQVLPFDIHDGAIAAALAGQAGVALENSMLYADIERLFEGFIKASVQAIEARDPTTAGHSFRVAEYSERLAVAVDRADRDGLRDVRFSREQMRELRYAALLHDFGKVGVREHVLVKAKKLHPHQLDLLRNRFRYARACIERDTFRRLLALREERWSPEEFGARRIEVERALAADRARLDEFLRVVQTANEPTVASEKVSAELDAVLAYRFPGEDGERAALIEQFEFADLMLSKGSLNAEERAEIESHVSHTYAFLSLIPWTRNLASLPDIAYAHHEKLDGSGYPRRLTAERIPAQSRIMTIADIYDALTAGDRPYKRGLPEDAALDILTAEAAAGKIDPALYRVFVESQAWQLRR